ncbi:MAG: hypothetical protein HN548_08695 [Opitutae bacterium]|jgi:hypothetical protein|nr:hypothetical protein [Opitutae bacterium]MBT5715411.1 hypothetical protein [Opitutae bacterium]
MKRFLKVSTLVLFTLFCVYILESACFRLVEGYANWRLSLAWGKPSQAIYNSFLKKLPLDHFAERPTDSPKPDHLGYWVGEENEYAESVMSFTRPLRDSYMNYIQSKFEPLSDFEIRDFESVHGVVLPGFKKLATVMDVQSQKARRVGDGLEFAKGIFIKIVFKDFTDSYREDFSNLEASFGFILERGFGCLVLPVTSSSDLLDKITQWQRDESLLAENLYAWADGKAASILMESCQIKPNCWKAIMITDPDEFVAPPTDMTLPWVYFEIDDERRMNEDGLDLLYSWVKMARSNENLYTSKLGGLVRINENFHARKALPSSFASYVLHCANFIEDMKLDNNSFKKEVVSNVDTISKQPTNFDSTVIESNPQIQTVNNFDLSRIEESINEIEKQDEINPNLNTPSFDCEIIRGYRQIHAADVKLKLVSNRDLIIKLGFGFEEMGKGVMNQIRTKDPLFYRYFNSLRAIEESPLN